MGIFTFWAFFFIKNILIGKDKTIKPKIFYTKIWWFSKDMIHSPKIWYVRGLWKSTKPPSWVPVRVLTFEKRTRCWLRFLLEIFVKNEVVYISNENLYRVPFPNSRIHMCRTSLSYHIRKLTLWKPRIHILCVHRNLKCFFVRSKLSLFVVFLFLPVYSHFYVNSIYEPLARWKKNLHSDMTRNGKPVWLFSLIVDEIESHFPQSILRFLI